LEEQQYLDKIGKTFNREYNRFRLAVKSFLKQNFKACRKREIYAIMMIRK